MEEWRDVQGYESRYEVSDLGRLRSKSFLKQTSNAYGPVEYWTTSRLLKSNTLRTGYLQVKLYSGTEKKSFLVHRLVAIAFLAVPAKDKTEVNHKNLIRNDNRLLNLEWVTPKENAEHAWGNNLRSLPVGEAHHQQRLDVDAVRDIRLKYSEGYSLADLGRKYDVSYQTIKSVVTYSTWKDVQ